MASFGTMNVFELGELRKEFIAQHNVIGQVARMMDQGVHCANPYHNVGHMMLVAFHAISAFMHGPKEQFSLRTSNNLMVAALMHDFNHSGGVTSDERNIDSAVTFVREYMPRYLTNSARSDYDVETVVDLIKCTWFDGKQFPVEPVTYSQKCLRDADLMMLYTPAGRQVLIGLYEEMNRKRMDCATVEQLQAFVDGVYTFQVTAELFTEYARDMRRFQLTRALRAFVDLVNEWDYSQGGVVMPVGSEDEPVMR
ncbi:hypothetical protein [Burkholderia phage BCSR5]|nr:hypothetical protein [Burkholderia phage BCSR5]